MNIKSQLSEYLKVTAAPADKNSLLDTWDAIEKTMAAKKSATKKTKPLTRNPGGKAVGKPLPKFAKDSKKPVVKKASKPAKPVSKKPVTKPTTKKPDVKKANPKRQLIEQLKKQYTQVGEEIKRLVSKRKAIRAKLEKAGMKFRGRKSA